MELDTMQQLEAKHKQLIINNQKLQNKLLQHKLNADTADNPEIIRLHKELEFKQSELDRAKAQLTSCRNSYVSPADESITSGYIYANNMFKLKSSKPPNMFRRVCLFLLLGWVWRKH